MKPTRIPLLVTDIIATAISYFDGMDFGDLVSCPACGGDVQGYDMKTKKFAVLRQNGRERVITVRVKRFYCRSCGDLCYADEPFYPGSRIGSPVIDLFSSLSSGMPQARAARTIDTMGIIVNRTTWKYYSGLASRVIPVVDIFGMRLPLCLVTLSEIATRSGNNDRPDPAGVLEACRYPSRSRATTSISRENV
jgi:hypothetical protein